jgi:hypothetical protein
MGTKTAAEAGVEARGESKADALATFRALVAPEDIIEAACRLGALQRQRKIDLPALVQATIAAVLPTGGVQTTAFANYIALTGHTLAPSAFYDRFSEPFAELMRELASRAISEVRQTAGEDRRIDDLGVLLKEFSDVQVVDSMVVTLRKLAAHWAPSNSSITPAGVKWHTLISLEDGLPVADRITPKRVGDGPGTPDGAFSPGTLTLMDLGYLKFERLEEACKAGAYFVMRLRNDINPVIAAVHAAAGDPVACKGLRLNDALHSEALRPTHGVVDLDVYLQKNERRLRVRVVGVKAPTDDLHFYITNIDPQVLAPRDIRTTYRLRWSIELFFKQLKSGVGLKAIRATRPGAVMALFYAKVTALCLARLMELSMEAKHGRHATTQLALVLALTRCAPLLLSSMMMERGVTLAQLEERIMIIASIVARSRKQRRERVRRRREKSIGSR